MFLLLPAQNSTMLTVWQYQTRWARESKGYLCLPAKNKKPHPQNTTRQRLHCLHILVEMYTKILVCPMPVAGGRIDQGVWFCPFRRQNAASKTCQLPCMVSMVSLNWQARWIPTCSSCLAFPARESCSRDMGRSRAEGPQRREMLPGCPNLTQIRLSFGIRKIYLLVCRACHAKDWQWEWQWIFVAVPCLLRDLWHWHINTNTNSHGMCSSQPAGRQEPGLFGGTLGTPFMCLCLCLFFLVTQELGKSDMARRSRSDMDSATWNAVTAEGQAEMKHSINAHSQGNTRIISYPVPSYTGHRCMKNLASLLPLPTFFIISL